MGFALRDEGPIVFPFRDPQAAKDGTAPLRGTECFPNRHQIAISGQYSSYHPGDQDIPLTPNTANNQIERIVR